MRRVRIAFILLVIGLALPMGWLVQRALGGVQIEREAQNRAVAERVFDEMERALVELPVAVFTTTAVATKTSGLN